MYNGYSRARHLIWSLKETEIKILLTLLLWGISYLTNSRSSKDSCKILDHQHKVAKVNWSQFAQINNRWWAYLWRFLCYSILNIEAKIWGLPAVWIYLLVSAWTRELVLVSYSQCLIPSNNESGWLFYLLILSNP